MTLSHLCEKGSPATPAVSRMLIGRVKERNDVLGNTWAAVLCGLRPAVSRAIGYMSAGRLSSEAVLELAAQLGQGAGEEAGDVHLGDADVVGDLGLGEVAVEAQGEDFLFAF